MPINFPPNPLLNDLFTDASGIEWQCIDATVGDVQWARTSAGGTNLLTENLLIDGVDYTSGSTTTIGITVGDSNALQLWVFFDGVMQHSDQYIITGNNITFNEAIPLGVASILVKNAKGVALPVSDLAFTLKNLFINPTFSINQRGYAGGTLGGKEYFYDRWNARDTAPNFSTANGVLTFVTTCGCEQIVEDTLYVGKMTLSWKGDVTAGSLDDAVTGMTSPWTFDHAGGNKSIKFVGNAGETLSEPKLEQGSVATPFEYPDIATEQAKCERYYINRPTDKIVMPAWSPDQAVWRALSINIPTKMRAIPAILTGIATQGTLVVGDITVTAFNISINDATGNGLITFVGWSANAEL